MFSPICKDNILNIIALFLLEIAIATHEPKFIILLIIICQSHVLSDFVRGTVVITQGRLLTHLITNLLADADDVEIK